MLLPPIVSAVFWTAGWSPPPPPWNCCFCIKATCIIPIAPIAAANAIFAGVHGFAPKAPTTADAVSTIADAICIFLFLSKAFLAMASFFFSIAAIFANDSFDFPSLFFSALISVSRAACCAFEFACIILLILLSILIAAVAFDAALPPFVPSTSKAEAMFITPVVAAATNSPSGPSLLKASICGPSIDEASPRVSAEASVSAVSALSITALDFIACSELYLACASPSPLSIAALYAFAPASSITLLYAFAPLSAIRVCTFATAWTVFAPDRLFTIAFVISASKLEDIFVIEACNAALAFPVFATTSLPACSNKAAPAGSVSFISAAVAFNLACTIEASTSSIAILRLISVSAMSRLSFAACTSILKDCSGSKSVEPVRLYCNIANSFFAFDSIAAALSFSIFNSSCAILKAACLSSNCIWSLSFILSCAWSLCTIKLLMYSCNWASSFPSFFFVSALFCWTVISALSWSLFLSLILFCVSNENSNAPWNLLASFNFLILSLSALLRDAFALAFFCNVLNSVLSKAICLPFSVTRSLSTATLPSRTPRLFCIPINSFSICTALSAPAPSISSIFLFMDSCKESRACIEDSKSLSASATPPVNKLSTLEPTPDVASANCFTRSSDTLVKSMFSKNSEPSSPKDFPIFWTAVSKLFVKDTNCFAISSNFVFGNALLKKSLSTFSVFLNSDCKSANAGPVSFKSSFVSFKALVIALSISSVGAPFFTNSAKSSLLLRTSWTIWGPSRNSASVLKTGLSSRSSALFAVNVTGISTPSVSESFWFLASSFANACSIGSAGAVGISKPGFCASSSLCNFRASSNFETVSSIKPEATVYPATKRWKGSFTWVLTLLNSSVLPVTPFKISSSSSKLLFNFSIGSFFVNHLKAWVANPTANIICPITGIAFKKAAPNTLTPPPAAIALNFKLANILLALPVPFVPLVCLSKKAEYSSFAALVDSPIFLKSPGIPFKDWRGVLPACSSRTPPISSDCIERKSAPTSPELAVKAVTCAPCNLTNWAIRASVLAIFVCWSAISFALNLAPAACIFASWFCNSFLLLLKLPISLLETFSSPFDCSIALSSLEVFLLPTPLSPIPAASNFNCATAACFVSLASCARDAAFICAAFPPWRRLGTICFAKVLAKSKELATNIPILLASSSTKGVIPIFNTFPIWRVKSAKAAPKRSYGLVSTFSAIAPNFISPCSRIAFINACLLSNWVKEVADLPKTVA